MSEHQDVSPQSVGPDLIFADKAGHKCKVNVAQLVAGFLAMDKEGLIPDPGLSWRRHFKTPLQVGAMTPGLAQYASLERVPSDICDCCGAEYHAVYTTDSERFLIERWSIVTSVMLLTERNILPALPCEWHKSLQHEYERICETGRRVYRSSANKYWQVERLIDGETSSTRRNDITGKAMHFELCPECTNPMLLINIDNIEPHQIMNRHQILKSVSNAPSPLERIFDCRPLTQLIQSEIDETPLTPEACPICKGCDAGFRFYLQCGAQTHKVDLATILNCLEQAQTMGIIPKLENNWWNTVRADHC